MPTRLILLAAVSSLALAALVALWLSANEVLKVRALESVQLFEPESLAGKIGDAPTEVGQLKAGEELPVTACVDRKSDINLYAEYQGKIVVVGEWKARVQVARGHAYPWEPRATTSCQGFFESVSTHA